ncbi:MAG: hypothetical protein H7Y88_13715 [Phycisphaerales bacterium]|nr:hypothetical protein [Phycisphaerales bacterium]
MPHGIRDMPADLSSEPAVRELVEMALSLTVGAPTLPPLPEHAATLRDFITDASLAALCDELSRATGAPIWLEDRNGEAIVPRRAHDGHRSTAAWEFIAHEAAHKRAAQLAGRTYDPVAELFAVPLRVSTGTLGHLIMAGGENGGYGESDSGGGGRRVLVGGWEWLSRLTRLWTTSVATASRIGRSRSRSRVSPRPSPKGARRKWRCGGECSSWARCTDSVRSSCRPRT